MLDFEDLTPGPHELSLDFLERCVAHVLPRPIRLLRRWLHCLWLPRGGRFRRLRRGRLSFSCLGLTQWMRKCDLTWSNKTYAILQYIMKYYHFLIPYQTSIIINQVIYTWLMMDQCQIIVDRVDTTDTVDLRAGGGGGRKVVVGEEWCQNAAPLRWYTKNVFAQAKMILSRAWLHDTVSCAAWNDARKGVYLKPLFKTPCSNCYWGWSKPIMLDYGDISLMENVPLLWRTVTASPVGIEPMTILEGGALIIDI